MKASKELYIKISPIILNYSGVLIDGDVVKELTTIPAQPFALAQFILENNIEKVKLLGNEKYTSGIQKMLYKEFGDITQYNIPIEITLEEIAG